MSDLVHLIFQCLGENAARELQLALAVVYFFTIIKIVNGYENVVSVVNTMPGSK